MSGNGSPGARIYFGKPQIGEAEREAVWDTMVAKRGSGLLNLTSAGRVAYFEERFEEYCQGGKAVAVSSCTAALHLAALSFFEPGDEVIVPALTHVSTAHAMSAMGAVPVFADCGKDGNVSRETIEPHITDRTRGIVVVHYLGKPCDMASIMVMARQRNLKVIEDCALAMGATYNGVHVGLHGDAGCFSFYPVKHMTTGEGGMLLTRSHVLYEETQARRRFGQAERYGDVPMLGLNYRMTEMQAALGAVQLGRMQQFLQARAHNFAKLKANLDFETIGGGSHYAITLMLPDHLEQKQARHTLKTKDIETSIYYPIPVPKLTYYDQGKSFPNAELISCRSICLPVGPHLGVRHLTYMVQCLRELLQSSAAPALLATA